LPVFWATRHFSDRVPSHPIPGPIATRVWVVTHMLRTTVICALVKTVKCFNYRGYLVFVPHLLLHCHYFLAFTQSLLAGH